MFEKSKWIWNDTESCKDTYAEFYDNLYFNGNTAKLRISVDSNYVVYINGNFVNSGQYPDFPHYKVYDELDITEYCNKGDNSIAIIVWYYGKSNFSYFPGNAALIYEIEVDGNIQCYSDVTTLSRKSIAYISGEEKEITSQLGFSFHYDVSNEDNWKKGELFGFTESVVINQNLELFPRPVKKIKIAQRRETKLIKHTGKTNYLFDIGFEEVGYLTLKIHSDKKQTVTVSWGEHIEDGCVRRIIGDRDFSVKITLNEGMNEYTNYFRRFGLRYLELFSEYPVEIDYVSVLPTMYPTSKIGKMPEDNLRAEIYKTSVRTLELCMHDHYEDCPWREQGFYAMDSRNQMLFGYYAFGEYAFPRASLYLFSRDKRDDDLLTICAPTSSDLVIPSFALHYITEVYEYTVYSGDKTLFKEIYPKIKSIITAFSDRKRDNGLLENFEKDCHWNFHEWAEGLDGRPRSNNSAGVYDCALNCLYVIVLKQFNKLCEIVGIKDDYSNEINEVSCAVREHFFDKERRLFVNSNISNSVSCLVNSYAVLSGIAGDDSEYVAEQLIENTELTPLTLSMLCFKYDALILVDKKKYKDYILNEIDCKFKNMLDHGATSFWETEKGASDFHNAGSLCHGWSALPIYYYTILCE